MNKKFKNPFAPMSAIAKGDGWMSPVEGSLLTGIKLLMPKKYIIALLLLVMCYTNARRRMEPEAHKNQYKQASEHLNGRSYQYGEDTLGSSADLDANQSFARSFLPESAIARERRELPLINIFRDKPLFDFRFTGYVKNVTLADTRQVLGFADNYILITPRRRELDPCGQDINSNGQFNIVPFETRLLLYLLGPNILEARSFGRIEGDFITDFSELLIGQGTDILPPEDIEILNRLRLRHAYFSLDWEQTQVIIGQTWHPYNYPIESPDTISFNTGTPIDALARNPQLRFVIHSHHYELMLTLLSERDFPSLGPLGFNSVYARNSRTPNFNALIRCFCKEHVFGVGWDFKRLVPRIETNNGFKTREAINSMAGMAYAHFHFDNFDVYIKGIYAENGANFGLIGGYAVHCIDPITDRRTYTNLSAASVWTEIVLHKKIEPGVFIGYTKNLGAKKTIITSIPGTGNDETLIYSFLPRVHNLFRVAPRVKWNPIPLSIGAEIEYTQTVFGDIGPMGNVINLEAPVTNTRLLFSLVYFF